MTYRIDMFATVYAPWEDGADEREVLETKEDAFHFDTAEEAVSWLATLAYEPSSWPWSEVNVPRMWYSGEGYEHPYTGTLTECTYHPCGCWSNGMHQQVWERATL